MGDDENQINTVVSCEFEFSEPNDWFELRRQAEVIVKLDQERLWSCAMDFDQT